MLNERLLVDFQFDGVETLDLFKLHFDRLIDPNIFSIKFNVEGILVLRVELSDYRQLSPFHFRCNSHIENKNPIGIKSFFLEWSKILVEDQKNYPFCIDSFMDNLSSKESDEEKRKKISSDEELFQYLEPEHVESLRLFGELDDLYVLHRAGCENSDKKQDYYDLERKYDAMRLTYDLAVEFFLKNGKKICSKASAKLIKKIESKVKSKLKSSSPVGFSAEEYVDSRWDEIGQWVYERTLINIAHSDLKALVEKFINDLENDEKSIVRYASLDDSVLGIDFSSYGSIQSLDDISYLIDEEISIINPIVENLLAQASNEWLNKIG